MLLGLIRPDEGTAQLFGRDPLLEGARALDGVAGFVEAPRFYPYLSGRRNLELVAALDGGDAAERIDDALDTVDLADRASDKVGGYSHGMHQRLGIAGALLRDPRLLLLDEPTTGLDPAGMRDMRALVHAARRRGHHRAALLAPDGRGRGAVRPRRDRRRAAACVYEGALRRADRDHRRPLRAAHDRRRARPPRSPAARPAITTSTSLARPQLRRRRARGRRADARARRRPASASARSSRARADARGAVLPDDRGRPRAADAVPDEARA